MAKREDCVCILGPNASGKTRLAAALAARVGGEVLNADSRQVYRRMDIGTGKDLEDYVVEGRRVKAHLIDIVDPGCEFNVFEYQRAFLKAYQDVRARDRLPVICGGSGMYLEAVLGGGYRLREVPRDDELRGELAELSHEELVERLTALRPLHATTDTEDRDRLVRAIEIAFRSSKAESANGEEAPFPRIEVAVFGIRWERKDLRLRITARLRARLDQGMVEEVRRLLQDGLDPETLTRYGLEYRYITQYVLGRLNRNDMFQKLNSAIHKFAKRQGTWFRRMERRGTKIQWLDGRFALDEKIRRILHSTGLADG